MTISPELFNAIEAWMTRNPDRDKPSMRIGHVELTPRQIVDELRAGSELGSKLEAMLKGLVAEKGQGFVIDSFNQ